MKKIVIALALGLLIGSAATAFASDKVQAVFAEFKLLVNGIEKQLETNPLVVDGTSYLPVREIAGLLGAEVSYDDATRTIKLFYKNGEKIVTTENLDLSEWVHLKDLAKHGVEVIIDENTSIIYKDKKLEFPLGKTTLVGKDTTVPIFFNSDNGATLMIYEGAMYLEIEDKILLGIE